MLTVHQCLKNGTGWRKYSPYLCLGSCFYSPPCWILWVRVCSVSLLLPCYALAPWTRVRWRPQACWPETHLIFCFWFFMGDGLTVCRRVEQCCFSFMLHLGLQLMDVYIGIIIDWKSKPANRQIITQSTLADAVEACTENKSQTKDPHVALIAPSDCICLTVHVKAPGSRQYNDWNLSDSWVCLSFLHL